MNTYKLGVVAHTSRHDAAHTLAATTGAHHLSIDDGTLGCEGNHRTVLTALAAHNTDWTVILEDDAIPCNDWATNLQTALNLAPTPIISLYLGTSRPPQWQNWITNATQRADQTGATWIIAHQSQLLHAVAYAIHTPLIPAMLAALKPIPIDRAITHWARTNKHPVAYTWPSLADHNDGPTLAAHNDGAPRNQPRRAHRHGTPNWNTTTTPLVG